MDFFQKQDDARRRTRLLVMYFIASVIAIIALMYLAAGFFTGWEKGYLDWKLLGMVAAVTAGTIGLGSGFKIMQLSGGGSVLAQELGGRALDPATTHTEERRLLNIVEEMSLASGLPVPAVWVLEDEEGINAFAAGHTPADAVVGVTRGCMRALTRDELQGVIAHEFSHILNGDMRLNLRLIGVVHGLLVMGIFGRLVMRLGAEMRGGSRSDKGADPRLAILLMGVVLFVLGYIGVFFGKMIKAAISRQREFLADAAAVQFTRNPESIGGALLKIGGYAYGSELKTPRSEEASHLMFSNAMGNALSQALSTHPPLAQRIKAILPHWDGTWPTVTLPAINAHLEDTESNPEPDQGPVASLAGLLDSRRTISSTQARTALSRIGQPTPEEIDSAVRIGAGIPAPLQTLLRDSSGAQAVLFGMLLSREPEVRDSEEEVLRTLVDGHTLLVAREVAARIRGWHSAQLIAMIDLSLPSLRRLTPAEYGRFSHVVGEMIAADDHLNLFEFMLQKVVRRHLDRFFRRNPPPLPDITRLADASTEVGTLLSSFAGLSGPPASTAWHKAWESGVDAYRKAGGTDSLAVPAPPDLHAVEGALDRLDHAVPTVKKAFLEVCAAAVFADGAVNSGEAELLRAVADTIGCPVPPYGHPSTSVEQLASTPAALH